MANGIGSHTCCQVREDSTQDLLEGPLQQREDFVRDETFYDAFNRPIPEYCPSHLTFILSGICNKVVHNPKSFEHFLQLLELMGPPADVIAPFMSMNNIT